MFVGEGATVVGMGVNVGEVGGATGMAVGVGIGGVGTGVAGGSSTVGDGRIVGLGALLVADSAGVSTLPEVQAVTANTVVKMTPSNSGPVRGNLAIIGFTEKDDTCSVRARQQLFISLLNRFL